MFLRLFAREPNADTLDSAGSVVTDLVAASRNPTKRTGFSRTPVLIATHTLGMKSLLTVVRPRSCRPRCPCAPVRMRVLDRRRWCCGRLAGPTQTLNPSSPRAYVHATERSDHVRKAGEINATKWSMRTLVSDSTVWIVHAGPPVSNAALNFVVTGADAPPSAVVHDGTGTQESRGM